MSKWINLGELMLQYGMISKQDLEAGMKHKKESKLRLGEALVELGKVTMEDIDYILSKQLDIPFVIVDDISPDSELLKKFRKEFLIVNRILPLYETDEHISIVIEDPFNSTAVDYIRESFEKEVNLATGSGRKIEELLKKTFNKTGLPALMNSIKSIIEKIRETSFYRIDFLVSENACVLSVFGVGILKKMDTVKGHFSNDDIFRALDDIGVPFLYEKSVNNGRKFVAVYPLEKGKNIDTFPAIIGEYGLFLPDDATFTDAHVHGADKIFCLEAPMPGYGYLLTKRKKIEFDKPVYTIDTAPDDFKDYYVSLVIPGTCPSCNGSGCQPCNDLGYVFKKIEVNYSSTDLEEELRED